MSVHPQTLQLIKPTSSAPVRLWCAKAADSDSVVVYVLSCEVLSALRDHWDKNTHQEVYSSYRCHISKWNYHSRNRSISPRSMASPSSTPVTSMTWWLRSVWSQTAVEWSTSPAGVLWPAGRPFMLHRLSDRQPIKVRLITNSDGFAPYFTKPVVKWLQSWTWFETQGVTLYSVIILGFALPLSHIKPKLTELEQVLRSVPENQI